jgi:hypothetical protein
VAPCAWAEHHDSGSVWWRRFFTHGNQVSERKALWSRCNVWRHAPNDLLPLARPHLPKFPLPPKIDLPAKYQAFNMSLCGTFHIQIITECKSDWNILFLRNFSVTYHLTQKLVFTMAFKNSRNLTSPLICSFISQSHFLLLYLPLAYFPSDTLVSCS